MLKTVTKLKLIFNICNFDSESAKSQHTAATIPMFLGRAADHNDISIK